MTEAFIVDAVRTPVGRRGGGLSQIHPADLGAHPLRALDDPHRHRSRRGRGRDLRLRRHRRRAGRRHRPHLLAGRRPPRARARHHRRPAVRLGPAGHPLRRPGGDGRRQRRRRRRRRAADVDDPDQLGHDPRRRPRLRRPVHRLRGLGEALRRRRGEPVQQRRDDRREVGLLPRRDGGLRGREPRAGHPGPRRGSLRGARSRRSTGVDARRGPARAELGEDPLAAHAQGGRAGHRRRRVADLRRRRRAAHRERAGPEGPRPHAPGAHPPPERAGRRPDLDAHRADPRHPPRLREDRA